jgi:adenine-specific DNA-methyltransferase
VQLDESIDKKNSKTAYEFVKEELGKENPTIFDITKERILRAGVKIQKDNNESKKPKDLSKQDFGFKVFEILPMFEGFFDEMDELDEQQVLFNGSQLSNDDLQVLLTSWMVSDGIKLTCPVEKITLDKYTSYYADKNLYLMDKGFTTDDLKVLIEKLDSVDGDNKNFQPNKLVLFGYNFDSKHQREISEALGNYTNKKQIELDRVIRY